MVKTPIQDLKSQMRHHVRDVKKPDGKPGRPEKIIKTWDDHLKVVAEIEAEEAKVKRNIAKQKLEFNVGVALQKRDGRTLQQIANEFDVSMGYIQRLMNHLKESGAEIKRPRGSVKGIDFKERKQICLDALNNFDGRTLIEIGKEVGVTQAYLSNLASKHGIVRPRGSKYEYVEKTITVKRRVLK